ncbi:hypothetical protein [Rubrolithibacter danxiaensis]|uniref:hypothetical protein n=1 Tax=Rubrolithibacter danxiaensis TaxID=3390805 RepID=UPI003BF7F88F
MKTIKVTYTVKQEFAAKNRENVRAFLAEVESIADPEMRYFVLLAKDGKTFSHISIYNSDESQRQFLDLPSFKSFQEQRDESGLEKEPVIEAFTLIDSSHPIF